MKICLLGTGIYGTAIALELAKKNNEIVMWTENPNLVKEFEESQKIASIIDVEIPKNIKISNSYEETLEKADVIFITCASRFVSSVCNAIKPFYKKNVPICIATKGIEESTQELLSNVVKNTLLTKNVAVISGPTFAIDMINNEPVGLALGSTNKKTANIIMAVLVNERLKLRPTKDLIGIQICGAVKNCIAIAAGILQGLGYSESTRALLINESLHDIKQIVYHLGGNPRTILSFAGVGDLTLTCSSTKSRNFSFGYTVGSEKNRAAINNFLKTHTVEGYFTIEAIYKLLKNKNIQIPLINTIYDIVYNDANPEILAQFLIEKE